MRPSAYLPQGQGLAQIRAALAQAGAVRSAASSRRAANTPLAGASTNPAARAKRKSVASSLWAWLVLLVVVLFSSGAGEKIISGISDLLQRK